MTFIPSLAYHFCLSLPAAFTQPGARLLAKSFPISKNALPAVTDAREHGQSRLLLMREFVAAIIDLFNNARQENSSLLSTIAHHIGVYRAVWFGCVVAVKTNDL